MHSSSHLLTQPTTNSCGSTVIQQYCIYTGIITHKKCIQRWWWMSTWNMANYFSQLHEQKRTWKSYSSIKDIQKVMQKTSLPIPVLWLVASSKNPHNSIPTESSLHWLHYYLLLTDSDKWFVVYNPFGYEEIISYENRNHLFWYIPSPTIKRKRYEKLLFTCWYIKKNYLLTPWTGI